MDTHVGAGQVVPKLTTNMDTHSGNERAEDCAKSAVEGQYVDCSDANRDL